MPDLSTTSMRDAVVTLLPNDDPDFTWIVHAPRTGEHLLVACEVSDFWQSMPAQAVRSAIAQRITRWATLLAPRLGVVPWGRDDRPEILIVAADQQIADLEAKVVTGYLADLNPPPAAPPPPPECGCPEHGWHLITCIHDREPLRVAEAVR